MKVNTHISNIIEGTAEKSQYDTEVKKVLSDKTILAWIMKYTVAEVKSYEIEEIRAFIDGNVEVATHLVRWGQQPESMVGEATEDAIPGEGKVTYDIRFTIQVPHLNGKQIKLIINIEAQKNFYPGYDLVTRGVFYGARLLSSQLDTTFTTDNYDDIQKVYSIWVCMQVPQKAEHTITRYHIARENLWGCVEVDSRYDLLEVIMVYLGRENEADKGTKLHGVLSTLLSETLTVQEKKKQLHDDYGIATSIELEGGLNQMCNLSDLIEERGIQKGKTVGHMEGLIEGQMDGLKALIAILKPLISNEEQLYQTVIQQEVYKDIPKEVILKYFHA